MDVSLEEDAEIKAPSETAERRLTSSVLVDEDALAGRMAVVKKVLELMSPTEGERMAQHNGCNLDRRLFDRPVLLLL